MSILPEEKTDVDALLEAGYTVTYSECGYEDCDNIEGRVDLFNAVREIVKNKYDEIDAPGDLPSVKYFDKESGKLFAARWIKKNIPERAVCERSTESGAGVGTYYVIQAYYANGVLSALMNDCMNRSGRVVRVSEDYYSGNALVRSIRRDDDTGRMVPDYCYPKLPKPPAASLM